MSSDAIGRKIARIRAGGKPRLLDLFAGCGGLSLGFQAAGYALQAAIEFDPDAARSHGLNFHGGDPKHSRARDIITTHPEDLVAELDLGSVADAVDVIVGGPPCQAFARVGRPKLREIDAHPQAFRHDPRARLYQEYLRYVDAFQPLAVLVENVPDVLNHGGQNIAEEICEVLEDKGYVCGYTLLNAAFFGVPQMRERMFLVAYRREIAERVSFPEPTNWLVLPPGYEGSRAVALKVLNGHLEEAHDYHEPPIASPELPPAVTAEQALGDLPPIFAREELAAGHLRRGARRFDQIIPYDRRRKISAYARLMRSWPGFEAPEGGLRDHVIRYLPRDYELFARLNPGDQYPQAWQHAMNMLSEKIAELRRKGKVVREGSAEYERLRDAIVPPYDATKFPNKWRKMWRDQPARTLMAHLGKDSYSHIHYDSEQARTISVREAARLQSFPDGFVFCGTMNPAFRQIGNAVPPLMAKALAETMMIALRGTEEQDYHVSRRAAAAV
ncbi:DNA cytosine methyltransferase [Rhizobium sp. AB2/73]|uniref:DNA cytosine methyltransferase n=1 Tax=Rhizobium sp. AB2/73 TaxID=2795216 RepID=UPI001C5EEBBC|nr:DNA cytosine methyltransferase [Rhizobium sp. AB2/73]QYA11891.1 DNA cytosine methyltransferase [Rhizobium sp. AB2/73]UEQ82179.1 DNA cytosine methyltransferase [Rhizobium sp. AB2/73]